MIESRFLCTAMLIQSADGQMAKTVLPNACASSNAPTAQ